MGFFGSLLGGIGSLIGGAVNAIIPGSKLDFIGDSITSALGGVSQADQRNAEAARQEAAQQANNNLQLQLNQQTNDTNIRLQQMANEANLRLAQEQNQWNIDQWNRNNEYNSPSHQLQLLREAGLNPALMYSSPSFVPSTNLQSADLANQNAARLERPPQTSTVYSPRTSIGERMLDNLNSAVAVSEAESRISANRASALQSLAQAHDIENLIPYNRESAFTNWQIAQKQERLLEQQVQQNLRTYPWLTEQLRADVANKLVTTTQIKSAISLNELTQLLNKQELDWLIQTKPYRIKQEFEKMRQMSLSNSDLAWQNQFRQKYGFTPNTEFWPALLQASLRGTLGNVAEGFYNGISQPFRNFKLPSFPKIFPQFGKFKYLNPANWFK